MIFWKLFFSAKVDELPTNMNFVETSTSLDGLSSSHCSYSFKVECLRLDTAGMGLNIGTVSA